jgi:hypothetical protein
VRAVFDQALRWSFIGVVVMAALTFIAICLIPVASRPAASAQTAVEAPASR